MAIASVPRMVYQRPPGGCLLTVRDHRHHDRPSDGDREIQCLYRVEAVVRPGFAAEFTRGGVLASDWSPRFHAGQSATSCFARCAVSHTARVSGSSMRILIFTVLLLK
jgi:hypothetical protein